MSMWCHNHEETGREFQFLLNSNGVSVVADQVSVHVNGASIVLAFIWAEGTVGILK